MDLPTEPPDWFIPALNKALTRLEYGQEKADAAPELWNLILLHYRPCLCATKPEGKSTGSSVY
jgi:hypothetical protein